MSTALPQGFEDLESLASQWTHSTEEQRNAYRRTCDMAQLENYYKQLLPRMEDIMEFLSKSPAEELAGDVERLAQLAFMFIEVASSVEFYREPDVPAGFSADRFLIHN